MNREPPFPIGYKKTVVSVDPTKQRNRYGRLCFDHKTGGTIEVMTKECWDKNKKYFIPSSGGRSCVKNFSKVT